MARKFYFSNVSPELWPFPKQYAMVDAAFPRERKDANTWVDDMLPRVRRAHQVESLSDRATLLRPLYQEKQST